LFGFIFGLFHSCLKQVLEERKMRACQEGHRELLAEEEEGIHQEAEAESSEEASVSMRMPGTRCTSTECSNR
jgi:hypothetical protein